MQKHTIILVISFLIGIYTTVRAQTSFQAGNMFNFYGEVKDAETKEPLVGVVVMIPDLQAWSVTNEKGEFSIANLKSGKYTYEVVMLGYEKVTATAMVTGDNPKTIIHLAPQSLSLDEVTVTAKERRTGSTSVINELSIQHLQAKSIGDLLQLVPGNLTRNPSLNTVGQAYIREISGNNNNALGTAVLVDGVPLSNDANLQNISTSMSGAGLSSQTTAGRGFDLRTISPDNIESVEVVRGIAGVEYGNLTSGAILVKTRSGQTPLEVKAKTDEFSKMLFAGKGVALGQNAGWLNLSVDYSQSYADIRLKYRGYERITSNVGYSNVLMKSSNPLSLNVRFAYFSSINDEKSDPQMKSEERVNNKNVGYRISTEMKWRLNKRLVSNLEYSFMFSQSHQNDYSNTFKTLHTGITPIGESYTDGEFVTRYLNASYYMESWVEGKPVNIFTQLKADKLIQFDSRSFTSFKLGAEWKYDVNKGKGLIFDPLFPPTDYRTVQTLRPRPYDSIPAMNVASAFLENKTQFPIGKTVLTLQGGVRLSNMFVHPSANRNNIFTVEPRFNGDLQFITPSDDHFFDDLSLVGGFGISNKMPTLLHLYPDKAYFDEKSFAYMSGDLSKALAIMTTKVIDDTSNPLLKPGSSRKFEIGLVGSARKKSGNITFFFEKSKNEYGFSTRHFVMPYNSYSVPLQAEDVFYDNGRLYYLQNGERHPAPVTVRKDFQTYLYPDNRVETVKKGIEYSLDLGRFDLLKTSLIIDGAWLNVRRYTTREGYKQVTTSFEGEKYPYFAVLPAGSGSIESRLNTNFRFITHVPLFKMLFSTTAQIVWFEHAQSIYRDKNGKDLFYKAVNPQGSNQEERYFVNPVGFWDKENNYVVWRDEFFDSYEYRLMTQQYAHTNYFGKEVFPIDVILNFRLTKEFGKIADFSFIANNFLNFSNKHKYTTSTGYANISLPMYFGAEIKIKLQ